MGDDPRSLRSSAFALPLFAAACAVAAVLLLLSSGMGSRLELWHFRTGFTLLKASAYIGLACSVIAVLSGILALRQRHHLGIAVSFLALILAILTFSVPLYWKTQADTYPRIHDITTDPRNPPRFLAISSLRGSGIRYGGQAVAAQQLKAYPDIRTIVLPVPKDEAFQTALAGAREMGWEIVAADPVEGRIEAVAITTWFGFKDDVSIRVSAAGNRSLVDIRSVSRVGISDVGTNAKRIRVFIAKLSTRSK